MPVQDQYLAYVLEQLAPLGSLRSNRMFGGIGLYSRELFFGLIDDDTLFFKTDESNIAPYRERRMPRFMPFPDRPEAVLGYHQVPADVIEDAEQLVDWARQSVEVALRSQLAKATRKRSSAKQAAKRQPAKKRGNKAATRKATGKAPAPKKRAKKSARRAK
jgi:DNA transformation protein and related proteins